MTATMSGATVEERLDALTEQVAWLVADARSRREERERWTELSHDLMPIGTQAMSSVSATLADLDVDMADVARLGRALVEALPTFEKAIAQLGPVSELASSVSELSGPALEAAVSRLEQANQKGYFAFAKGAAGIADRVVTSFTEEDVQALGDNIVLILNTVKDMTQPEVMGMLQRTLHTVQEQEEPIEPPSMFGLLKEMRDPEVRRGLGRMLAVLRSMGQDEADQ